MKLGTVELQMKRFSFYKIISILILQDGPEWLSTEDWILIKVCNIRIHVHVYIYQTWDNSKSNSEILHCIVIDPMSDMYIMH